MFENSGNDSGRTQGPVKHLGSNQEAKIASTVIIPSAATKNQPNLPVLLLKTEWDKAWVAIL